MDKQISIVVIDLDKQSNGFYQTVLKEINSIELKIESNDLAKGIELIRRLQPHIAILNLYPAAEPVLTLAREITKKYPKITLFMTSKDPDTKTIIQTIRAGAREFLCQPIKKEELINAVVTAARREEQADSSNLSKGQIVTFFGVKGGVGTTTIVSNFATSMAQSNKKKVAVIDLNLQLGNTALFLNIKPKYSILDIAKNIDHIDADLLKKMLQKNRFGVSFLTGPQKIEDAETITHTHVEEILGILKNIFDYTIIDTQTAFNDMTLKVFDESDHIFMVTHLDVPALYNAKRCLDLFKQIGYYEDKIRVIVNQDSNSSSKNLRTMEKILNYPIYGYIPRHDEQMMKNSINRGMPIVQMVPKSKTSQSYHQLVESFCEDLYSETNERKKTTKKWPFLKPLLK